MPIYDSVTGGTSIREIGKVYDFTTGATSGKAMKQVYDSTTGATSVRLVWAGETDVFDYKNSGHNANTMFTRSATPEGDANVYSKRLSDGSLGLGVKSYNSQILESSYAYIKLTGITASKVKVVYSNSINHWDARSTYFGIASTNTYYWYDSGSQGRTDVLTVNGRKMITSNLGNTAHNRATNTFDFGADVDLNNYYFVVACSSQGDANVQLTTTIYSIMAE